MFFTIDDYKKIQHWLLSHAIKDTDLNEAKVPFSGEEIITVVQDNQNKRVFLKDIVSQIFNLGVPDFINIDDKYHSSGNSLEEAIRLIPSRARKTGQVITFTDSNGTWKVYQFRGALNQWNITDQWYYLG